MIHVECLWKGAPAAWVRACQEGRVGEGSVALGRGEGDGSAPEERVRTSRTSLLWVTNSSLLLSTFVYVPAGLEDVTVGINSYRIGQ